MFFTNNDLTEKGMKMFNDLYSMWLEYADNDTIDRIYNVMMLEKYYTKILQGLK